MKHIALVVSLLLLLNCSDENINLISTIDSISNQNYRAIDSCSGRGKYLVVRFETEKHCSAAKIEENNQERLLIYNIESFDGQKWNVIHCGDRNTINKIIHFDPIYCSAIRLHHIKAIKIPIISNFVLYEADR